MKKILTAILAIGIAASASAAAIDDARDLYRNGNYREAIAKLKTLLKSSPKDGNVNYYLGASYYMLGDYDSAQAPLKQAESRGVADAPRLLAEMAYSTYNFENASEYIRSWEDILRRNKKDIPDDLGILQSRIILAKNMLSRVEKIEFVDSIQVSAADFFRYYVLPASAGELIESASLPGDQAAATSVVYLPENGKEYIWSKRGDSGHHEIVTMDVLDDGTVQGPFTIGDDLGAGGDADYPYLCSDGVTFYFAANGENTLGGYDIFMSRRDDEGGALQPQNIGMPYNSPYNDYMLAIDEENNLGWWASDRYCPPGMVNIYTFRPNDKRVNYPVGAAGLREFAMLKKFDIDPDGRGLIAELDSAENGDEAEVQEFDFPINGKSYTKLSDFKNPQAAQAMRQLLERQADLAKMESQLAKLRAKYTPGNTKLRDEILQLERRILAVPPIMERLGNTVITLEGKK